MNGTRRRQPSVTVHLWNCQPRTETIQIHNHEWNGMRKRRHHLVPDEGERADLNSTRNGNREPEIIPSSRRDSLVSFVCVFRIVQEHYECLREFLLFTLASGLGGSFTTGWGFHSFRSVCAVFPSYLLINRNKLPPWYSHCGAVCRFTALEEIAFP